MKTQEEIEQLAEKEYRIKDDMYQDLCSENNAYKKGYAQCQNDILHDQTVTRFEVIDENGRVYTRHNCKVELSYQDDGRTLKVFLDKLIELVKNG